MSKYCENCGRNVDTKVITKKEVYDVCGDSITVDSNVLVCANCGEEFFCEEFDNNTLINAYNEYRRIHKLLLPEEIKRIREQYGLSQRSFAKLLNWGDKTICRYENGSIQDKAHNSLMLFLRDPHNMREYLDENEIVIDEKLKAQLLENVEKLENKTEHQVCGRFFNLLFSKSPCEENGFKEFDYEKLCAMVVYFAQNSQELLKTKLMKLLNYSDMIYFKENGVSMSGLRYAHLQYGPVPDHFDIILSKMTEDHIAHIEVSYDGVYEKHKVVSECDIPENVLSDEEVDVLNRVQRKFKHFGSVEISEYSHKEKGYQNTASGEIISYMYAMDIDIN